MKTKTIIAIAVGVIVLFSFGATVIVKKVIRARRATRVAQWQTNETIWKTNQWPQEREQEIARIKSRQLVDETTNAATINLRPYINAKLTDAPSCWKGNNDNNLSELPAGRNIYAGVPFDVSGSIQLTGGWLKKHYHKTYPVEVTDIRIDRKCGQLHLLQGNSYLAYTNFGVVVAKLVVHYDDGTFRELKLVAGQQAFDFWCPLFQTGIPAAFSYTAPGTERAWTGTNPYIQKWQPVLTLVLYKTTFDNPQPDIQIDTVDFVSTETITAPFLVGLTVE
ncbi:MAG TPA: hypothetical protein VGI03_02140 [Verrucomicrobiae bacterium]|jgi:hypothetical protein